MAKIEPLVETRGLRKDYGSGDVLKGVNLRIEKGTLTGIAGPNGCGKTTLIKCLLGLVVPSSGEIRIGGEPVADDGKFRRRIGYMPQNPDFPPNLRLSELLEMLEDLRGETALAKDGLIDYFHLGPLLNRPFGQLSGGTKQKFSGVIALMFDAPLIILDEPTTGLDPVARVHFKDLLLKKIREGKTIALVSHLMSEVEDLASRLVFLNEGQVIYSGGVSELIASTGESGLERALTHYFFRSQGDQA